MDGGESALTWASAYRRFDQAVLIRRSPWGTTFRLEAPDGALFLKCLPPAQATAVEGSAAISALLGDAVPPVVAFDAGRGFLLSVDHGGQPIPPAALPGQIGSLLHDYARLQARAAGALERLGPVPRWSLETLLTQVDRFVAARSAQHDGSDRARLADFQGLRTAALIGDALAAVRAPLRGFLTGCAGLPITLEHGDLNPGNVAMLADGSRIFHDWDNALLAPAGLSLSSLIGPGSSLASGMGGDDDPARHIAGYAECLAAQGYAPLATLRHALPASLLAGLLVRLVAYAHYPPHDEATREVCLPDLAAIGEGILAWCARLAPDRSAALGRIVHLLGTHPREDLLLEIARSRGADALLGAAPDVGDHAADHADGETLPVAALAVARLAQAEALAREPGAVPAIAAGMSVRCDPALLALSGDVGAAMLAEHGCLALEQAFAASRLSACLSHHLAQSRAVADGLPVGDQRVMHPLSLGGPFNAPELYAQPLILTLMSALLGPDFLIGSITLVVARPGAGAQHLHADHPPLFAQDAGGAGLPAHAFTLLIPLVDTDDEVGGTEVFKGSHRRSVDPGAVGAGQTRPLSLGSGLLFDYRLLHRGLANRSSRDRPVLSIVYQRSWFRDAVNFTRFAPLQMSLPELKRVPGNLSGLFRLAHLTHD
jgi:hypothetical protein